MSSNTPKSENVQKNGDKAQRQHETGQQNQGEQRNQPGQQNQGTQRNQPGQQNQGHRESGGGQQTGGSHGKDDNMNRKEGSK